jgi:hypothetical protein
VILVPGARNVDETGYVLLILAYRGEAPGDAYTEYRKRSVATLRAFTTKTRGSPGGRPTTPGPHSLRSNSCVSWASGRQTSGRTESAVRREQRPIHLPLPKGARDLLV